MSADYIINCRPKKITPLRFFINWRLWPAQAGLHATHAKIFLAKSYKAIELTTN